MKKQIKLLFATLVMLILLSVKANAGIRGEYGAIYGILKKDSLTITSFSEKWTNKKLEDVYNELLNNTHGAELAYLSNIYMYPDNPDGVEAYYYEDVSFDENGFHFGQNAYIELFKMDEYTTVSDIAYALAHEYGHHYTIYNVCTYENKYYNDWKNSGYSALRSLTKHPVDYGQHYNKRTYQRVWDIVEIIVGDYMQLLSSPNAKRSYAYDDSADILAANTSDYTIKGYFNSRPQENLYLPLATDVNGLYEYLLTAGGITKPGTPYIEKKPSIKSVKAEESFLNPQYTLELEPAEGNGPFEYTVVMYPAEIPFYPTPIKTVRDGDVLKAVFGTVVRLEYDGSLSGVFEYYGGEYIFRIFAMDVNGYYYSSELYKYDFGDDFFDMAYYLNK